MHTQPQVVISNTTGTKKYRKLNLLGTGGFARCFLVTPLDADIPLHTNSPVPTVPHFACKIIPKKNLSDAKQRFKLMLEIKIHKHLKSPFIVGFEEVFQDHQNIYIVMEYCKNQTLKDLVKRRKRLTEFEVRVYAQQMVSAIQFTHSKDIIHRDLKLGNILIGENMMLKICDFGLSTKLKERTERKKTVCGTPNYIAPEILDSHGHGLEVDIWALGVILFTMLTGKPPFEDDSVESTYFNIRNNHYKFPDIGLSKDIRDLISKMLVTDPSKRISIDEISKHRFLRGVEETHQTLPTYTLALPPMQHDRMLFPKESMNEPSGVDEEGILNKSIIIKDSSHNYDSEYIEALDFSLKNKSKLHSSSTPLVYVAYSSLSNDTLGFVLSNAIMGVYFLKDQSCLLLDHNSHYFNLYQHTCSSTLTVTSHYSGILQPQLTPKYQTMSHFKELFEMVYTTQQLEEMRKINESSGERETPFVKRVIVVKNTFVLRLSNGVVEANFVDQSVVLKRDVRDEEVWYYEKGRKGTRYIPEEDMILDAKVNKKISLFTKIMDQLDNRRNH